MRRLGALPIIIAAFLGSRAAQADNIDWRGLSLSADAIAAIDGGGVRIEALGYSRIVREDEAGRALAIIHLSNRAAADKLPRETLERILRDSISDPELSLAILRSLLTRPDLDGDSAERLLIDLGADPRAHPTFKALLKDLAPQIQGRTLALVMMAAAEKDPLLVKSKFMREILDSRPSLESAAGAWCARTAVSGDVSRCGRIIEAAKAFWGEGDRFSAHLSLARDRIDEIYGSYVAEDLGKIGQILERCAENPVVYSIVSPAVRILLEQGAQKAAASGDLDTALELLSKISPDNRSARTRALVITVLSRLDYARSEALFDASVISALADMGARDKAVEKSLLDALERVSTEALYVGDQGRSYRALEKILSLRPDPSSDNDQIRLKQAQVLSGFGLREAARRRVLERSSPLNSRQKAVLFLSGYYGELRLLICLILIPILSLSLAYTRRRSRTASGDYAANFGSRNEPSIESQMRKLSPRFNEYSDLLGSLGLEADSDWRDIKLAYRRLVKDAHPDAAHGESADEFINISKAYKRIIELRRELGLDVEN